MNVLTTTQVNASQHPNLEQLPNEIFVEILKNCDERDFTNVACTSRNLANKTQDYVSRLMNRRFQLLIQGPLNNTTIPDHLIGATGTRLIINVTMGTELSTTQIKSIKAMTSNIEPQSLVKIKKEARSIEDKIMLLLHESSEEHIIVRFRGDQLKIVDSLRSTSFEEFVDLNFWLLHNYPKYNSDDILTVLNLKIQDTGLLSRALMIFSQALVDQDPQNFIESQKFARAIPDEAMRMRTFGKIIEKLCKKDIQKSLDFFIPHFLELANTVSDSFQGSQLVSKVVRSLDNSRYYSNIDYLLSNYHGANKAEIEKRLKKGRTLRG